MQDQTTEYRFATGFLIQQRDFRTIGQVVFFCAFIDICRLGSNASPASTLARPCIHQPISQRQAHQESPHDLALPPEQTDQTTVVLFSNFCYAIDIIQRQSFDTITLNEE